ncbi:CBS domain-containing protein CBSX5 [Musa acuminata AAA Group]|uniref:CBS domain-containing protein CBSX5 n=1 Tax=Musa acuminata AAA Group TaxID=214697 RepID=UPI0031D59B65
MAVSLVSNEVSDLCIGKPALRSLPLSAAVVGDALFALRGSGEPHLAVVSADRDAPDKKAVTGKLCVADVICYLCSDGNLESPTVALERPVSVLLSKGAGLVRRVERQFSVLEALDLILDGAQNLVVPIGSVGRKKLHHGGGGATVEYCWLTHEDFVRYFLNSIAVFSPIATLSIDAVGLVRSATALTVRHDEPGLALLPVLRRALSEQAAVAVVTDDGRLLGEISPLALSACDLMAVTLAAGVATLTAGDLMAFVDYYGSPPESLVRAIREGLKEKGLQEMLELMEDVLSSFSHSSSSPSASSSSSSDEESCGGRLPRRLRSRSFSMGRRSEEPEVCHPGNSLVAVMVQALAHRVSYLWVVDEDDYSLIGIVTFADMLRVFREQLQPSL